MKLLVCWLIYFDTVWYCHIEMEIQKRNCFSYDIGMERFQTFDIPEKDLLTLYNELNGDPTKCSSLLTIYLGTNTRSIDVASLSKKKSFVLKHKKGEYEKLFPYIQAIFKDLTTFPVGVLKNKPAAQYEYDNSWHNQRDYGGNRLHEGCDIMATYPKRGIYPIYSASNGRVDKIGWLKLGGYRIGIRSESNVYYYYAHLYEYAKEFQIGDTIKAGELLGFMGDSGYSEVEGTFGNFPVHLHFGIYFTDPSGVTFPINPYPVLYLLEHRKRYDLCD